jgi:hypothetical protein
VSLEVGERMHCGSDRSPGWGAPPGRRPYPTVGLQAALTQCYGRASKCVMVSVVAYLPPSLTSTHSGELSP